MREILKKTQCLLLLKQKKGVKRTIEAKKPSPKEVLEIMKFSIRAARFEGKTDADSLEEMVSIYEELPRIAAQYSLDKKMDEKWWNETAKFAGMMNFVTNLILQVQSGSNIPVEQTKSFR